MCVPLIQQDVDDAPEGAIQNDGIWGAALGGLTGLSSLHLNVRRWGRFEGHQLLLETVQSLSALTRLEQLTLDVCGRHRLLELHGVLAHLTRLTKLHVYSRPHRPYLGAVHVDAVLALAQAAVSELPQLRELHLPVTAIPRGDDALVSALLAATHLRQLTLDLFASSAHILDPLIDVIPDDWAVDDVPEVADCLGEYKPLFPHLCTVNVFAKSSFWWLYPLATRVDHLCQLHALRLQSSEEDFVDPAVRQILQAPECWSGLRELSVGDCMSLPCPLSSCRHPVEMLQSLTRLTSLHIPGVWLTHVRAAEGVALPPSLEKLALVDFEADHVDAYVSALAPLFLKTLVIFTDCSIAPSLKTLLQELPHLRDVDVRNKNM